MKTSRYFFKFAVFSFLIDPLFYASALITIVFASFKFFFAGKFFIAGLGSTDLRPFFTSIPLVSVVSVPLLVLRLRSLILDDSLPFRPLRRFSVISFAAFSAFSLPVLLMIFVPFSVSFFGTVDFGQCFSGYLGIFFYGFSAISLSIFFFAAFSNFIALPLIFSSVTLALVNFTHLLPVYLHLGKISSFLCRALSFAWHFDSFGKGILDSRNFFYYIALSLILFFLSACFEFRRLGKKISKITIFLFAMIFIFLSLSAKNLYFRLDLTNSKQFSLSETSKNLLSNLDEELRITYFVSNELKNLYPQTDDVKEFLFDYANSGKISLSFEKTDGENLKDFGIRPQQIRRDNGTKTEFVTVYSAILLQYLEKSAIIPFVLSTENLEYDLTERVRSLITEKERKVYLLCGNGRSIEDSYSFVSPWLTSRGFSPEILNDFNQTEVLKNLSADDEIVIFGTKDLNNETAFYLSRAIDRGTKAFFATSPFHTSIEEEWKVTKSKDSMISYLNSKGFAFENALVEDISCYPITMESGEVGNAEYSTVNYPLWLSLQSQKWAKKGVTLFWASPISLYDEAEPLLFTTNFAWIQRPSNDERDLFLTNPFLLPKSAKSAGASENQFVVAARNKNISVVSDQFFVSSLMTGFISSEGVGDFRNYDYLARELLLLRGENEIAHLMEKSAPITSLYKIVSEDDFKIMRARTIVLNFVILPILMILLFVAFNFYRRRTNFF